MESADDFAENMQCGDSVWTFQLKESAPKVWRLTYFLAKIESDVS